MALLFAFAFCFVVVYARSTKQIATPPPLARTHARTDRPSYYTNPHLQIERDKPKRNDQVCCPTYLILLLLRRMSFRLFLLFFCDDDDVSHSVGLHTTTATTITEKLSNNAILLGSRLGSPSSLDWAGRKKANTPSLPASQSTFIYLSLAASCCRDFGTRELGST